MTANDIDPLTVPCPRCGAQPRSDELPDGEHCRTVSGRYDTQSHKARHEAAEEERRMDVIRGRVRDLNTRPDDQETPVPDDTVRTADAAESGLTIPDPDATPPQHPDDHPDDLDALPDPDRAAAEEERMPTDPAFRKARLRAQRRRDTPDEATTPPDAGVIPDDVLDELSRRIAEQVGPAHPLGQTVWFRSRTGRWTAPATITATSDSLYQPNVDAGHLPPLSSDEHVHLTVLTPGIQGHVSATTAETHPDLVADDRPNKPAGGSFQEWDIAYWAPSEADIDKAAFEIDGPVESAFPAGFDFSVQPPGTWTWPL